MHPLHRIFQNLSHSQIPAVDTSDNDTDNQYENIADDNNANECRNDNISDEDKKENSTSMKMEVLIVTKTLI